jgi:hypothetical protein
LAGAVVDASPGWSANGGRSPLRGTLRAPADTLGRVTLSRGGSHVSTLRARRYTLVVVDRVSHSGLILDRPDLTQLVVTSSSFVGVRTMRITLTPGSWSFQRSVGALHEFTVAR